MHYYASQGERKHAIVCCVVPIRKCFRLPLAKAFAVFSEIPCISFSFPKRWVVGRLSWFLRSCFHLYEEQNFVRKKWYITEQEDFVKICVAPYNTFFSFSVQMVKEKDRVMVWRSKKY